MSTPENTTLPPELARDIIATVAGTHEDRLHLFIALCDIYLEPVLAALEDTADEDLTLYPDPDRSTLIVLVAFMAGIVAGNPAGVLLGHSIGPN